MPRTLWEAVAQGKVFPQVAALKTRLTSLSSDPLVEHAVLLCRCAAVLLCCCAAVLLCCSAAVLQQVLSGWWLQSSACQLSMQSAQSVRAAGWRCCTLQCDSCCCKEAARGRARAREKAACALPQLWRCCAATRLPVSCARTVATQSGCCCCSSTASAQVIDTLLAGPTKSALYIAAAAHPPAT